MEFNNSSFDTDLFYTIISAVNISLFFLAVFPGLILCLLCVLALFLAQSINRPLKIALINIFASEICQWSGMSVWFLGYPVRAGKPASAERGSCFYFFGAVIAAAAQKFLAIALYSIMVYIFLKHGVKKLKLKFIIPFITVSWVFAITLGALVALPDFGVINNDGFCNYESGITSRTFIIILAFLMTVLLLSMLVISIFSILVYRYTRKNILEDNVEVKRAVVKNLAYLLIATLISFLAHVLPVAFNRIREALAGNLVLQVIVVEYILRLLFHIASIATPIVAIIILKPVHLALKKIFQKTFCYKRVQE